MDEDDFDGRFVVDDVELLDPEGFFEDESFDEDEFFEDESFDDESFDEDDDSFDDEPESFDEEELLSELLAVSDEVPGGVVAWLPRLSVLKKPDPLKVTPTG